MTHFDITADNHDEVVTRLATMVLNAPDDVVEAGLAWYGEAHDSSRALASDLGITHRQAAGVFAAASPGVEAGLNFGSIHLLLDGGRLPERQRNKARMCLEHDPVAVLDYFTGPKTWSFFWNIYAPTLREHVTVDGRHADIIANVMRPWKANRGIDHGTRNGRYESYEFVTEDTARALRMIRRFRTINAPQVQAILWCEGKRIETQAPTLRGTPRVKGCHRKGQPYC